MVCEVKSPINRKSDRPMPLSPGARSDPGNSKRADAASRSGLGSPAPAQPKPAPEPAKPIPVARTDR
jgi:hypothetical protein